MPIGFTDPEKKADKNMQTDTSETAKKSEKEVSDQRYSDASDCFFYLQY